MVRKLNKAKKPEGSLVSRQKAKLEDQRRKKRIDTERARKATNAEKYEQEKSAREAKGGKGYGGGYPGYLMGGSQSSSNFNPRTVREQIISHLLDEGFASDERSAESIMGAMSEAWVESIFEGGFNSSGRYDVGGGRTVGPVAGAVRSLFSGNLPKGQTYVPPSPQKGTNRPPAVPSSKNDSGKLTDFGAGGGKAKLKTGMSVGQVERQGRMNRGDYSG